MSWEYSVGVFGGVSGTEDGRFRGIVSILLADGVIYVIESEDSFATAAEAEREYDGYGKQLLAESVQALQKLGGYLRESQMIPGSRIPICPLKDFKVFRTSAYITQPYFCAAMKSGADQLLAALPPLTKEEAPEESEDER